MPKERKTKAYFRFKQRCDYYETDLELCEVLVSRFLAMPNSAVTVAVALGSNTKDYPRLSQLNSRRTREVRGGHLKQAVGASFIKDLYEDFVDFLSETMARAAQKGVEPGKFAGEAKIDMKAVEISGSR